MFLLMEWLFIWLLDEWIRSWHDSDKHELDSEFNQSTKNKWATSLGDKWPITGLIWDKDLRLVLMFYKFMHIVTSVTVVLHAKCQYLQKWQMTVQKIWWLSPRKKRRGLMIHDNLFFTYVHLLTVTDIINYVNLIKCISISF